MMDDGGFSSISITLTPNLLFLLHKVIKQFSLAFELSPRCSTNYQINLVFFYAFRSDQLLYRYYTLSTIFSAFLSMTFSSSSSSSSSSFCSLFLFRFPREIFIYLQFSFLIPLTTTICSEQQSVGLCLFLKAQLN